MKKLHIIFIFLILNINVVNANDKIDCSKYSKFTKKYLICTINQLKKTTKEKTSKITKTAKEKTNIITKNAKEKKNKIKEKIDLSDTKSKIKDIKKSKTLTELFRNKND